MFQKRRDVNRSPHDTPDNGTWIPQQTVIYSNFLISGIRRCIWLMKQCYPQIRFAEIHGGLSTNQRHEIKRQYNTGEVHVLYISSAGAEGIDLKGTRNMYILEPPWNPELLKQIKGRMARLGSHTHLPKDEQDVSIFLLILDKPDMILYNNSYEGIVKTPLQNSVDRHIYNIIDRKRLKLALCDFCLLTHCIETNT